MKLKILAVISILSVINSIFVGSDGIKHIVAGKENSDESTLISNIENNVSENLDLKEINVAILAGDRLMVSRIEYFIDMLTDYEWIVGDTKYNFNVNFVVDKDILFGKLKTKNYDMIVVPGGGVGDGESVARCFPTFRNFIWKRNFANFIKQGGGYYGVCGGTALITDIDKKPRSFLEYAYEKSSLGVSCVKSHFESLADPIFLKLGGLPPEYVGEAAYVQFSGWNTSNYSINYISGASLDCPISKNNPIFKDYLSETRRIRWVGGPGLVVPENPDREVMVLAYYPEEEMCENKSTDIHVWKYTGGICGILKAFIKNRKNNLESLTVGNLANVWAFFGDWERTDKIIKTDFSNRPAMTAEIYPNENQARIILSGLHPEYNVWWGGEIVEAKDTDDNTLWDALHGWVNVTPNSHALEWKYNYWINRRCVAWVSKLVPDCDLPPVYGPSEIKDIEPSSINSSDLKIFGKSETSDGIVSLDLFYRYSSDTETTDLWSNWALYDTDFDVSDGWSWEFNSTKTEGPGYYQFYSIRHVQVNEYEWLNETVPPGPDAIASIEGVKLLN